MVTQDNPITETDIDTLIGLINTEENIRTTDGSGYTDIAGVAADALVLGAKFQEMVTRLGEVNTEHCYCQAYVDMETHSGGVGISITSSIDDYHYGECNCNGDCGCNLDSIYCTVDCLDKTCICESQCTCNLQYTYYEVDFIVAAEINEINSDITNMAAQCDCDSFICSCETACTCVGNQTCSCDYNCVCNGVCSCNLDRKLCSVYCVNKSYLCPSNCGCFSQNTCPANQTCGCDADCSCNTDCTCDEVCNCEYGG